MNDLESNIILKRIIDHFVQIAPGVVKTSVESLATDRPVIDLYDIDFYLEKMEGAFDDVDETKLREVATENLDEINAIFLMHYKDARADNYRERHPV
jgi:hypothetical protein